MFSSIEAAMHKPDQISCRGSPSDRARLLRTDTALPGSHRRCVRKYFRYLLLETHLQLKLDEAEVFS